MAETPPSELQPASENPWYRLATARKDHAANRDLWNGYMRHLIGAAAAANLKRGDGTPLVLPTLSPDEIGWIEPRLPFPPRELPSVISLSGLTFAAAVNFQDFYFPVSVDFSRSTFAKEASFSRSTFAGEANFRGSTFAGPTGLVESTFAKEASFSRSTFAEEATFRGSTFGGEATFTASTFAGEATFGESTFAEYATFTASTFAGEATFTASTFTGHANFGKSTFGESADFRESTFGESATFRGSTFAEYANFRKSTFGDYADFEESIFTGYADFEESIFTGYASFTASTFAGIADFAGSTFAGIADFNNSEYSGETSFQNVTFKVAPLFFATTLHEDTDWTDVNWPAKPADKDAATQYVRRYDRLALIMNTLQQPDNEHRFFRLSMHAKEVRDGKGISTSVSRLYGLFRYGWGLEYALKLWVFHILLGAGCLSVMALWQRSQPLPHLAKILTNIVQALAISFSNSHPFLGLQRGPVESAYASFHTLTGFNILWTIQSVSGPILLFFLLLTIRNRFRLR